MFLEMALFQLKPTWFWIKGHVKAVDVDQPSKTNVSIELHETQQRYGTNSEPNKST